jgi:hypothetical protein
VSGLTAFVESCFVAGESSSAKQAVVAGLLSNSFIGGMFGPRFDLALLSRITSEQLSGKDAKSVAQLRTGWKEDVIGDAGKHLSPSLTLVHALGDDGNAVVLCILTAVPWAPSDEGKLVADSSAKLGLFTPASPESALEVLQIRKGQNSSGVDFSQSILCRSANWGPCLGDNEGVVVWDGLQDNASYCKLGSDRSTFEKPGLRGRHSYLVASDDSEWYFTVVALETWSIAASETDA